MDAPGFTCTSAELSVYVEQNTAVPQETPYTEQMVTEGLNILRTVPSFRRTTLPFQ